MFLADNQGCSAHYDTIADDGDMDYYIEQIAEYDDHWRFNVIPDWFDWDDFDEVLLDILFDDGQDDDFRKATNLLSLRFNQIGIACNCHPVFERTCAISLGKNVHRPIELDEFEDMVIEYTERFEDIPVFDIDDPFCSKDKTYDFIENYHKREGICGEILDHEINAFTGPPPPWVQVA